MKSTILAGLIAASAYPALAFAGWGAIAYNSNTGRSAEAHGFNSYGYAVNEALALCGYGCSIINWEQNSCVAFATGFNRFGEAHGLPNANLAIQTALAECGNGCTWREWACN